MPVDLEPLYDDLDATLGNQSPHESGLPGLIEHLRGHVRALSRIAVADPDYPPPATVTAVIARGRLLLDEPPPHGSPSVGLARRLAFVTSDLAEGLLEVHCIKDAD
ncbi:DUF6415 family natural product biosynthesis protein [Streptomyces sp. NPDC020607]|uniref:DUF6415 family natural product biosynthesis protein n=1 Tax=Streptomyces sp. NPDC020607 TaxID=3365082 RepID=UPI0037922116